MNDKLLIIISTGEAEKAVTGMMYAVNSLLNGWMDEVKLFFFGPAEKLLLGNKEIQEYLLEYIDLKGEPVACKYIADKEKTADGLNELGVSVQYVGEKISDAIKEGFVPMIW